MLKEVRESFEKELSEEDLFKWHSNLFSYLSNSIKKRLTIDETEVLIKFIIAKANFLDDFRDKINERQTKVINKMLANMPFNKFESGINTRKYQGITSVSKATATRDLQYLQSIGVLKVIGRGRSTSYELCL